MNNFKFMCIPNTAWDLLVLKGYCLFLVIQLTGCPVFSFFKSGPTKGQINGRVQTYTQTIRLLSTHQPPA